MNTLSTVIAAAVIGGILWTAEHFGVLPWALGFIIAALAHDVRKRTEG